jgi:hypothetical protein
LEYIDDSFGTMSNNENQIESPKNEDLVERQAVITVNIN